MAEKFSAYCVGRGLLGPIHSLLVTEVGANEPTSVAWRLLRVPGVSPASGSVQNRSQIDPPGGSRLSEDFVAALYDDFQDHGSAAIAACRAEKPDVYVRVIASLLPRDVNVTTRSLDDLSDDQLMRKLAMLTEMARPLLAKLPTVIDVTPSADVEPHGNPSTNVA